jgi:hypothetical protein
MPGQFGVSFLPNQGGMDRERPGGGSATEPIQQAIKVLSLRLPRVLGGGAFAPAGLLQGGGSMGNPFAGVGPMQGRPLPGGLPGGGGPPLGGGAGSPGGGSPFGGGAGNPFAGSMPGPDPMSQAIMALVGGGGGGFGGAPPSFGPTPPPRLTPGESGQPPARPTPEPPGPGWQPPQIGGPERGPALPPPGVEPPPIETAPTLTPEPEPSPDNGDLPRELAMWLYRNRGRGFEY